MSESQAEASNLEGEAAAELVEVGVYATTADGFERGLVALAIDAPFWLMPGESGFRLMVRPEDAVRVHQQLGWFEEERAHWPPRPMIAERLAMRRADLFTPMLWVLAVLASFWMQGESREWTAWGALDARAVFERGEVWRTFTALFLHADIGHLVSNTLSGVFVFSAVVTTMGRARGWLLLAVASVAGNFAAVALHYGEAYRSIGASTAVFAALGLLTGRAVRAAVRDKHPQRWRTVFVPLAAGIAVLGLYGAGGVEVDVVAHLAGFAAGLGCGFVGGEKDARARGVRHESGVEE